MTQPHITAEGITLHTPEDFDGMREAGRVAAQILDEVGPKVLPGVRTGELDAFIDARVRELGTTSATIGYRGYRHASCISVNHVVCHGIPGAPIPMHKFETVSRNFEKRRADDRLLPGDILNIDVTVIKDGWYGDSSRMFVAGEPSKPARKLIQVAHDALMMGIEAVRPGARFWDIGNVIQSHAEANGMTAVEEFCGHGLGRVFHAAPNVMHYTRSRISRREAMAREDSPVLEEGMFFTIEPMINLGKAKTETLRDDWTAVTFDRLLSAQFEHSIGVTTTGAEIFTLSPEGRFFPAW